MNTTNNETAFIELRKVFEEKFYIEVQELFVPKYLNFLFFSFLLD